MIKAVIQVLEAFHFNVFDQSHEAADAQTSVFAILSSLAAEDTEESHDNIDESAHEETSSSMAENEPHADSKAVQTINHAESSSLPTPKQSKSDLKAANATSFRQAAGLTDQKYSFSH